MYKRQHHQKQQGGFTLVELMLSMTFVSVLLLAIAMCSMQIGTIYQRGLTLKEVNQAARLIVKDVQSTINTSSPFDLASSFVTLPASGGAPVAYRICTGSYTYLINTTEGIRRPTDSSTIKYTTPGNNQLPRFVRVHDTTQKYCQRVGGVYPTINAVDAPVDLLEGSDRSLAVHTITSFVRSKASAQGTTGQPPQAVYMLEFILGTTEEGTIDAGYTCKPPNDANNNLTYCAINEFRVTARAGNEL